MKIILIGPVYPYRGGIAHFTSSLAGEMKNAGHEITVISFKRQYPRIFYPGKSDKDPSKEPLIFPAEFVLDPLYPWTWEKTRRVIKKEKPDLVVFQWWTTFWAPAFGWLAGKLRQSQIGVCFLIHNVYPHERRFWDKALTRFALKPADGFLTMAESQKNLVTDLFPEKPAAFSPHPTYKFLSEEKVEKNIAREQLGVPIERKVALFFGFVRPYKGLKLLLEAVGELKRTGKPIHLLIAGEFWEDVEEYQRIIAREGLEDWVTIHNRYIPNEEVPIIFSAADVFVAPYTGGTQSGVVKLAMGYGIPIVETGILTEDVSSIIPDKHIVVHPGDIEALAHAVSKMAEQPKPNVYQDIPAPDWKSLCQVITGNFHR